MQLPIQFISASALQAGLVLAPALICAAIKRSKPIAVASALTLVLYMIQSLTLALPNIGPFDALQYNWLQKLLAFLLTAITVFVLKYDREECGFKVASIKAFGIAVLFAVICTMPALINDFISRDLSKFTTERLLFELSMPGLQEEPFYRGLLLLIWDRAVGRPFNLFGVQIGWGALISLALFTLGHLCMFDKDFHLLFAPEIFPWLDFVFFCLAMTWLRYKYNSFWPPVLAHNLGNTIEVTASLFIK